MQVKLLRSISRQPLHGIKVSIPCSVEGLHRRTLNGDVVRMHVAADRIKGDDHLRFDLTDEFNHFRGDLFKVRSDQGLRMVVIWGTCHA